MSSRGCEYLSPDPTHKVIDLSYLLNDDVHYQNYGSCDKDHVMSWFSPAPLQEVCSVPEEESVRAALTEDQWLFERLFFFYPFLVFCYHGSTLSANLVLYTKCQQWKLSSKQ